MSLSKLSVRLIVSSACVVSMSAVANAQYRASIQGVVMDPQGAVVSGAKVTVTAKDTAIAAGGIAFRSTGPTFFVDTVRRVVGAGQLHPTRPDPHRTRCARS